MCPSLMMGVRSGGSLQSIYISTAYRAPIAKIIRKPGPDLLEMTAAGAYHRETICVRHRAQSRPARRAWRQQ